MKKKFLILILVLFLILSLTGCNNKSSESKTGNSTESEEYLDYNLISEFKDGTAIATKTINFQTTQYVIDENFNVLFSYKGNETFVGKYMKIADPNDEKKINIVDQSGEVVYSYDDKEFKKKVELVSDGLLVITEQTDTYNSSKTVTGIYDIQSKKYILEPDEKYVNKIREFGDNMLLLNDDNTEFFNTKTKKIVKYQKGVKREFKNGYSIDTEFSGDIYIVVFDDAGNYKTIKPLFNSPNIKNHSNGMLFDSETRIENEHVTGTYVQLINLKNGTIKNLSDQFNLVEYAKFNSDGNALVLFQNQGGETYYTVIDINGNMLFNPEKRNNEAMFGAESNEVPLIIADETLYDGGYFFGEEDNHFKVIDKNNKVIFTSDNEYETFVSISNNCVLVALEEPGKSKISYYKDLKGNKVNLKINDKIKEYN